MGTVDDQHCEIVRLVQKYGMLGRKRQVCVLQPPSTPPDLRIILEETELNLPYTEVLILCQTCLRLQDPQPLGFSYVLHCELGRLSLPLQQT